MALKGELDALVQKRLKQDLQPLDILAATGLSSAIFAATICLSCFSVRYEQASLYQLGILFFAAIAAGLALHAYKQYRAAKAARRFIVLSLSCLIALAAGWVLGNRTWYEETAGYYSYKDMASYVNIDPSSDRGQSYMDAGTLYFKEGSHVDRNRPIGFRNGLNYCVAPIVRTPLHQNSSLKTPDTFNRFVLPRSGTVDFWAVGIDCCDDMFMCGDSASQLARSGLRALNEQQRSMYLLAVQEWSAATGLPVRHPLFFHWVKDPILSIDSILGEANQDFTIRVAVCLVVSLVMSFLAHLMLQKMRVV